MRDDDKVILLNIWTSAFGMRAKIALAEKGVKYEYIEEDVRNKSPFLLQMNPIHKKVPILIHNGKPVCESLNIVEYIDQVWTDKAPLLPSDPYQRSQARFWADLANKRMYETGKRIWRKKGEEQEVAKREMLETLKLFEAELGDNKPFFGGDDLGFVDIALVGFYSYFYSYEAVGKFSIEASCPRLIQWANRCMLRPSVSDSLPDPKKVCDFLGELYGFKVALISHI